VGPEVIPEMEMEKKMQTIRQRIKEAQDRQKSYADAHRVDRSYEVGDRNIPLWRTDKTYSLRTLARK
jgi:hypothetical protein